jgi:xanthine phosphoribosyltransferase
MRYYGYEEFTKDMHTLVKSFGRYRPDALLAIARGGLSAGHFIAQIMDIRHLYSINSIHYDKDIKLDTLDIFNIPDMSKFKRVLIIDDIIDSGDTMVETLRVLNKTYLYTEFKTSVIFYKSSAKIEPDFYIKKTDEWIDFFWEVDSVTKE